MSTTEGATIDELTNAAEECNLRSDSPDIVLDEQIDITLLSQWPKIKKRVPTVFLHKTEDFAKHVQNLLNLQINFYQPYLGTSYTRIFCATFDDHKNMLKYFDENELPYHTFGHPSRQKMRVVIRGLPADIPIVDVKKQMKSLSIPIIRVHQMQMKSQAKSKDVLLLAVLPFNEKGKQILRIKKLLGYYITMEPAIKKITQCHRCQKWGHAQRYCHGIVKCVKCAGDHFTKNCSQKTVADSPTCANCGGNHTANFRQCFYCPDSDEYKKNKPNKKKTPNTFQDDKIERVLVTLDNFETKLYKTVKVLKQKGSEKKDANNEA